MSTRREKKRFKDACARCQVGASHHFGMPQTEREVRVYRKLTIAHGDGTYSFPDRRLWATAEGDRLRVRG